MDPRLTDYIIHRIETIDSKVDKLLQFKWQIIGGAGAISFIVTLVIQVLAVVYKQ